MQPIKIHQGQPQSSPDSEGHLLRPSVTMDLYIQVHGCNYTIKRADYSMQGLSLVQCLRRRQTALASIHSLGDIVFTTECSFSWVGSKDIELVIPDCES